MAGLLMAGPFDAHATLEVSGTVAIHATGDFDAPLRPYGSWVEVRSYGRCWRPAHVAVEWRPYCYGHWIWTDCGWYWESDEPWGWACYHYGAWIEEPEFGWVWVPAIEWAPAWVCWRTGGGYIGWAPLPPRRGLTVTVALPPPPQFVFVETTHFREPLTRSRVMVNNTTIVNRTTVVSNMKQESRTISGSTQKVMVNPGPAIAEVQKASGTPIRPQPIEQIVRKSGAPADVERRNEAPASAGPTEPSKQQVREAVPPIAERKPALGEPRDTMERRSETPQPQSPFIERKPEIAPRSAPPGAPDIRHGPPERSGPPSRGRDKEK